MIEWIFTLKTIHVPGTTAVTQSKSQVDPCREDLSYWCDIKIVDIGTHTWTLYTY